MDKSNGESLLFKLEAALRRIAPEALSESDAGIFRELYDQFLSEPSTVDWDKVEPLHDDYKRLYHQLSNCTDMREIKFTTDRLCTVKLNGGLATTMGCDCSKSLIEIRKDLTFLDLAIKHNQYFNELHHCAVPLILMNSFYTNSPTWVALEERGQQDIRTFMQSTCPRLDAKTLLPLPGVFSDQRASPELWYPPGHGNIFISMARAGILDEMLNKGREICFISNIDNVGATIDLKIAKYMLDSACDYVMECVPKTENDKKGGVLIQIDGRVMHLETPQVPKEGIEEFSSTEIFREFNTNNIWVNLNTIRKKLSAIKMEIIVNRKLLGDGTEVVQLETSVGGAIRNFDRIKCIIVPRDRFLPVKSTNDFLLVTTDFCQLTKEFAMRVSDQHQILRAHVVKGVPVSDYAIPLVRLSPAHFARLSDFRKRFTDKLPHLCGLVSLTVAGNVYFGDDVVFQGKVEIEVTNNGRLELPNNSFYRNTRVSGHLTRTSL